ncbi:methyltransferase domain-containing protein [Saccharopolyspora sp. NPDC002376]
MTTIDDTTALRARLADHLSGITTTPMWRDAFRTVPRHLFAPQFAIHNPAENNFVHHDVTAPDNERREAALAAAYTDDTLITRFSEDGTAISSSTEPSLMANMLEALDVQPGHRVLEVGAGTGYNAALLCEALGDSNITTIDVDSELVDTARAALTSAGYAPTVVCGNGAAGAPDRAPFDRIIATCGVDRVPAAWLGQIAPGGAILVNVSKGIVLLRHQHHAVSGRFISSAGFMALRSAGDPSRSHGRHIVEMTAGAPDSTYTADVAPDVDFTMAAFFSSLIAEHSQLVFVHDEDGDVSSYRWIHPATQSWARVDLTNDHAAVNQSGARRLWTELAPVLDSWHAAGRPGLERYGLTVTGSDQHTLWLDHPDQKITVLD